MRNLMIAFLVAFVVLFVAGPAAGQTSDAGAMAWPPMESAAGPLSASAVRAGAAAMQSEEEEEPDEGLFGQPWLVSAIGWGAAAYVYVACERLDPPRPFYGQRDCNAVETTAFAAGVLLGWLGAFDGMGWYSTQHGPVKLQAVPTGVRVSW